MWDLIVSVPVHCLSFYLTLYRRFISQASSLIISCSTISLKFLCNLGAARINFNNFGFLWPALELQHNMHY